MTIYAIVTGKVPHQLLYPKEHKKMVRMLKGLQGLQAANYNAKAGATMLFFDEYENARRAKVDIALAGYPIGRHIMWGDATDDWKTVKIVGPVKERSEGTNVPA